MPLPKEFADLRLPIIVAPLFIVSGAELVTAACNAGLIGTFPSLNARTPEELDDFILRVKAGVARGGNGSKPGMFGVNLVCHRTNQRLSPDMEIVAKHRVPLVITSAGDPSAVVRAVKAYGGFVLADVTDVRWARKAAATGVDGLILVCAGAGGHAGIMNPFALLPQVREFFDGIIVLGGAISDGRSVRAAEVLGADLVYMGTRFVATAEANTPDRYRTMLIESEAADLVYTDAFSGIPANMLKGSIRGCGLDPDHLPAKNALNVSKEMDIKAWRDIWSAGQGVGSIHDIPSVAELVARLEAEYRATRQS